jgi:hypothetical protein
LDIHTISLWHCHCREGWLPLNIYDAIRKLFHGAGRFLGIALVALCRNRGKRENMAGRRIRQTNASIPVKDF